MSYHLRGHCNDNCMRKAWHRPLTAAETTQLNILLGFGGLGGNNGRQSLLKDDVLVSLSTPGPANQMFLGAVGPPFVGGHIRT